MFAPKSSCSKWVWPLRILLLVAALASPATALAAGRQLPGAPPLPLLEPGTDAEFSGQVYIVQPGDNLTRIAQRLGTTVDTLVSANQISTPNFILAGSRLIVPIHPLSNPTTFNLRRGLAMAVYAPGDLETLGVGWYYTWGWCVQPRCLPMAYFMEVPPACPPVLLVGNEPNAVRPFGGPLTPAEAARKVLAIENACPQTRLVAGNVAADDWRSEGGWGSGREWLVQFFKRYQSLAGRPYDQTIGVHCYADAVANYCLRQLADLRSLYAGPMWVTEFGILSGGAPQYAELLGFIDSTFERYAVYTNRQPHTGEGWELGRGVELVLSDGRLAPAGQVYAAWPSPPQSQFR